MKDINISVETIKRHAKRLQKILIDEGLVTPEFKLTHAQEIFSKSLGCNNWFELNESLKKDNQNINIKELSNMDHKAIISLLSQYLNQSQGNVDKKFWYALMSCYYLLKEEQKLEKVKIAFKHKFNEIPLQDKFSSTLSEINKSLNEDVIFSKLIKNNEIEYKPVPDKKPKVMAIYQSMTPLNTMVLFLRDRYEVERFLEVDNEYIKENNPDLIICDERLLKGFKDLNPDIPLLIVKRYDTPENPSINYLALPFSRKSINDAVDKLWNKN